MTRRPLAIFDVDGTIFRSSLMIEITEALINVKLFPQAASEYYQREYLAWLNREAGYEDYLGAVVEVFMKHIKGVAYKDFAELSEKIMRERQSRVYRYTRDLVKKLHNEGYFLLAISQSPKNVLDHFCKSLGFDKVYGRFYEIGPTDRFTGEITDEHLIANKANIVKRVLEREPVTLEGSLGVGDTEGDISFLEMVETAICFNPNARLYKIAKLNGWKVVVERKDVIYELD